MKRVIIELTLAIVISLTVLGVARAEVTSAEEPVVCYTEAEAAELNQHIADGIVKAQQLGAESLINFLSQACVKYDSVQLVKLDNTSILLECNVLKEI